MKTNYYFEYFNNNVSNDLKTFKTMKLINSLAIRETASMKKVFHRIHINSIDMSKIGILDSGGIGFSIDYAPISVKVKKLKSKDIIVKGFSIERVENLLAKIEDNYSITSKGWEIDVVKELKSHIGLGSTTQIEASIVESIFDIEKKAQLKNANQLYQLGIGMESGIGVKCFLKPGFHIDFGYLTIVNNYSQKKIRPLENSISLRLPKEWRVLICVPRNFQSISGEIENEFWKKILPLESKHSREISYWVLMGLIPSVLDENFELFIHSLNQIITNGSKPFEENLNKQISAPVLNSLRTEMGFGGLSSLGPTCYTFINSINFNERKLECLKSLHSEFNFEIVNIQYE